MKQVKINSDRYLPTEPPEICDREYIPNLRTPQEVYFTRTLHKEYKQRQLAFEADIRRVNGLRAISIQTNIEAVVIVILRQLLDAIASKPISQTTTQTVNIWLQSEIKLLLPIGAVDDLSIAFYQSVNVKAIAIAKSIVESIHREYLA